MNNLISPATKSKVNKKFVELGYVPKMTEEYTLREAVFRAFMENPSLGPKEMTSHLKAKYNSVKAVFAKLCEDGLLKREGRGNYSPNISMILLHLLDRIEVLENGGK